MISPALCDQKESPVKKTLCAFVASLCLALPLAAQNPARALVTRQIDETQRTTLHGNVSALAQARFDQGTVADSLPASRVLLMLNRPADREFALQKYLADAHDKNSATYHRWLTPRSFGEQFGPADGDIQTVTSWLGSKGFRVAKVSQSKQFIEFSGTAGQLRDAFQADIHRYNVDGETHFANSRELTIPTALAQVVRGLAPLNNFNVSHYVHVAGAGRYSKSTHGVTPDWTVPNPFGGASPFGFLVGPEDLATQYDITPLYQAGTNGTGQTIGILDGSNIDLTLVANYMQMFGVTANPPVVIIDGDDPGDVPGADVETYLDVEVSGAIAPKSTVNLYIADGGSLADPVEFAAIRAVEDNAASVLSASFGQCEAVLGESGNEFWASLWEQAAAQGQTVMVSSGDSGSACGLLGVAVSGVASTPWNVAVGGTDFFYADYATGGASAPSFWNATNDANLGSLKAPIQEQAWNDPFGLDVIPNGFEFGEDGAGGGGASNCATSNVNTGACTAGYPKPSWQTGPGVPADGVRDIPDVSLFASNGANLSSYAICAFEGECASEPATDAEITFVGGTSASAPLMAGVMALVNQRFGRQGQANFTMYALAQQKPSAFHDITQGSIDVPCNQGTPDCAENQEFGVFETSVYPAGTGYDLATGLGSIDANQMVTNWSAITFKSTTTTLTLSPMTITHGAPVTATATVSGQGSGTPTGDVSLLTTSPEPGRQSLAFSTLSGGSTSESVNFFPGGTYEVTAAYSGNGIFGSSTSAPVTLNVTPENSVLELEVGNNGSGFEFTANVVYDSPVSLIALPVSVAASTGAHTDGYGTGSVTFKVDSASSTVPLDAEGLADFIPPTLAVGTHTVNASYAGDASFNPSTATPITVNVSKGMPALNDNIFAPVPGVAPIFVVSPGSSLTVAVQVAANNSAAGTAAPTGTVMACLGTNASSNAVCVTPIYTQSATLASSSGIFALISTATVTFPNLAAGEYVFSFSYSGDANWQSNGFVDLDFINVQAPAALAASMNVLSLTPASVSGAQLAQVSTTITGSGNSGSAPSGLVAYYDNGLLMTESPLTPSGAQKSTAMFLLGTGDFLVSGANQITSIYEGDTHYLPSSSNAASITVTQVVGNFTFTPSISEVTVQPGSSASVALGLASTGNFSGMVTMTCSTSSLNITCGVPALTMLSVAATPSLMVTASSNAGAPVGITWYRVIRGPLVASAELMVLILMVGLAVRTRRPALLHAFGVMAVMVMIASCGGGGGGGTTPPPPPPPAAASYSVIVNATGNGFVHSAKITVFVP